MFAKDDIIEYATCAEDVADWMRFCCHILYVDDLWSHVAWGSASYEKVVWVVGYRCQSEVDYDRLFAKDNVVRL